MKLSQFDFSLPEHLIAQTPLKDRSSSRLLVYDRQSGEKKHLHFHNIIERLGDTDVLVLNNSRVLRARIAFENKEILLSEPLERCGETNDAAPSSQFPIWRCMVRKGKFFSVGKEVNFADGTTAVVTHVEDTGLRHIRFETADFGAFLESHGQMPTPPYIREQLGDQERYQTVYAEHEGSVAAPTAGLHFTPEVLQQLEQRGVQIEYVTLHVGLGTFLPVTSEDLEDHAMHSEYYELPSDVADRLNQAKRDGKTITAVGSTAMRTLESCASHDPNTPIFRAGTGKTDLFLYPPAQFYGVDHLLTNFHLPKSTLIMLVSAFLSPGDMKGIEIAQELYREAIEEEYRFFSFGDAMLIW